MKPLFTTHITPTQLKEVVDITMEAFFLKIKHIWLFPQNKEQAATFLEHSICINNGIYILSNEHVMGFVGLSRKDNPFFIYRLKTFITHFGLFGGTWRYAANIFYDWLSTSLQKDEISIETIAISNRARGQGLGAMLLDRVFEIARIEGKRAVVLEVVDTNPKAQALYERKGFVGTHTEKCGDWTAKANFTSITYMRKEITQQA